MPAAVRFRPPFHRQGFTLFEVAISLALVAFGVISVLMLFPAGIKAQQLSRYQILASVRAMEMVDIFSSATDASLQVDREGPHPWDTATSYHAFAPDLETRIGSFRYGLFPLPLDIAHRLDSDGDEIQQVLADGGYIYYSQPSATSGFNPVGARANLPSPNESQKLLCAVTGYAQQNAIPSLSYKDWPYHTPYPSPPMHILNTETSTSKPTSPWNVWDTSSSDKFMLWEDTLDADNGDMALVFRAIVKSNTAGGPDLPLTTKWVTDNAVITGKYRRSSGYWAYGDKGGWILDFDPGIKRLPPGTPIANAFQNWSQRNADGGKGAYALNQLDPLTHQVAIDVQPDKLPNGDLNPIATDPAAGGQPTKQKALARESALAYFALAKWYANKKHVSAKILDGVELVDDGDLLKTTSLFQGSVGKNPALAINAARLLAHAAMCVTDHLLAGEEISLGALDVSRDGVTSMGTTPILKIKQSTIDAYVANAMKLGMRFSACYPYDWGSPRPLNRATMMDFPLMQYDPFCSGTITPSMTYFSGYTYGSRPDSTYHSAKTPEQWKIITAQPIANIGRSICYPSMNLAALWPGVTSTTPSHFTLARNFEAADRCRQMIFWAVDWQAYEDFETAPSAPVDASRYPKRSPHGANLSGNAASPNAQRTNASFADRHQFCYRNPEKTLAFLEPTVGRPTGDETIQLAGNDSMGFFDQFKNPAVSGYPDPVKIFSGMYGADRNFNGTRTGFDVGNSDVNRRNDIIKIYGKLDRGPVPKSVRMRATMVGRFNFYDPRVPLVIR